MYVCSYSSVRNVGEKKHGALCYIFMLLSVHVGVYGRVFLLLWCMYSLALCFSGRYIRDFAMVCVWLKLLPLTPCIGRAPHPHRFLTCAFTTVASLGQFVRGGCGVVSTPGHPQLVYYYISILRMISQPPECVHEMIENIERETHSAA